MLTFPTEPNEIDCNGAKQFLTPHFTFYCTDIPQGRGLVQLNFVTLVKNDVKVNTKGGSKCNSKQSLRLVTKLIYI